MTTPETQYKLAGLEIARHLEDARSSKLAHFLIAEKYASSDAAIQRVSAVSFAGIVVCWFVTSQIYGLMDQMGNPVPQNWATVTQNVIPIGLAMASVVATTFQYLYRFGEASRLHREAAQQYHRLFRKCCNWRTEAPDPSFTERLVEIASTTREELSEVNHHSPDIPEWAWRAASRELAKGGTEYSADQQPREKEK